MAQRDNQDVPAPLLQPGRYWPPTISASVRAIDADERGRNSGDVILVLLTSANRDPQLNESSDTFILDRAQRRSFTFGAGRHQCPGQMLALNIASATLKEILAMKPALDQLKWHYRPSLNGRIALFSDCP